MFRGTINVNGTLMDFASPRVMGILNVTPDSFFAASRNQTEEEIARCVEKMVEEGADMVDVGACSTRPGADAVAADEEMRRLRLALTVLLKNKPDAVVSVDTYRGDVARMCVNEFGVAVINDISGWTLDEGMFSAVADLHVPYVLTHIKGNPKNMQQSPEYGDLLEEEMMYFSEKVRLLREKGVCDIILDPGFGFGKTLEDNYLLMSQLHSFEIFDLPVMVGVSRKSMVYNLLGTTPENALNGTTALQTIALTQGADILRVHDVKAAVEAVRIYSETFNLSLEKK